MNRFISILIIYIYLNLLSLSVLYADTNNGDDQLRSGFFPLKIDQEYKKKNAALINLGRKLYFEKALSKDRDISCNTCHDLNTFGVDHKPVSQGHKGQKGTRNSPSVYNAALHIAQFWDGRAKDVEEQALGPILNPVEMAMESKESVVARLREKGYEDLFKKAFPAEKNPLLFENIGKAIGAFERTLITPSRFDKFLNGDNSALTKREKRGLKLFKDIGCIACHNGATIGGLQYQKIGVVKPYKTKDLGRYLVTKVEADKFVFKVPSLRNIAETAPYFHDGSIKDLKTAVKIMGEYQLGRNLSNEQINDIIAFLNTLTGELPKEAFVN